VQKAAYFLQEMLGVPLAFQFTLYKHGPFSFDLRDELSAMRADGLVSLRVQDPMYGPSIVPEPAADVLRERFPKTLKEHEPRIAFVASRVDRKAVAELERLATAFYVRQECRDQADPGALAQRVHTLKPHVAVDQALPAVEAILDWAREAATLCTEP
jgi:hypothetical protein